ncbi:penicillin-binding transpeptidase domain-containing protein [Streptomyces sp. NPDC050617]|uniref:peptidoglycan D,D-transpeptidase FtsI family protein n=1 Tax=Streptomyces sp. NPDC050617 TaxID=3154628 RepID=UPI00344922F4
MNKPVRRTAVFSLFLVFCLLVWVTWVQAAEAGGLDDNPHNERLSIAKYAHPLGDIVVGGDPVTGSAATDGDLKYKRTYRDGPLYAPVTGYSSQIYGSTQLEALDQPVLDGTDPRLKNPGQALLRESPKPGDVITTIDPAVQKAAYKALGGKTGAAVALDPATGKILGMASTPSYDPGSFAGQSAADQKAWEKLQKDPAQPMVNRALRQPLAPGSTFKLVVAAAALENGLYSSIDEKTRTPDPYLLPGTHTYVHNESAADPCENATLREALQYSCNTVFANVAVHLGEHRLSEQAEKFGFNDSKVDVPARAYKSVFPSGMNAAQTGLSGFGQFDVTATPLEMAMVTSAIANDGKLMTPYVVDRTTDGSAGALDVTKPRPYKDGRVMSADTARQLQSAMRTVVEKGTGGNAKIDGLTVGGKTGTAQHGVDNSGKPYAWFVSYAQDGHGKQIAVAVMVQSSDAERAEVSGNGQAAPVAKAMMRAALG